MKTNPLGDVRAENDHEMLDRAFYETPEYRSLLEERTRRIVIGRRGTGKSALFYRLINYWEKKENTTIITLTPQEADVIGIRFFIDYFGNEFTHLRTACSYIWQFAILNEMLFELFRNYKVRSNHGFEELDLKVKDWHNRGDNITSRLFSYLNDKLDKKVPFEKQIALLAQNLQLKRYIADIKISMDISGRIMHIVADRLDDGYKPDSIGIAILTGLIYALDIITSELNNISSIIFLRDNIFRSIQRDDPNYSRNIEGDVLRLHWEEHKLFTMICYRIKEAFNIPQEKNLKIWDQVTARNLKGKNGFRLCLRLTLYRPRDLMVLINRAFNHSMSNGSKITIVDGDIEQSAREISCSRLDDLVKEYSTIIPGLDRYIKIFSRYKTELLLVNIQYLLKKLLELDDLSPEEGQTLAIIQHPIDFIKCLFSIGFIGVWTPSVSSFVFCHDGKSPDFSFDEQSKFLVHPCYWIGLNLSDDQIDIVDAEEIYDEYDIKVFSETPEIRKQKIKTFIDKLGTIPMGGGLDAKEFEDWCCEAIRIVFATGIVNVELNPNKNSTQRRDVVGRNTERTESWKRIFNDYNSRQVVFEIKNYDRDLGSDEYRQMLSYLTNTYGKIGFIVNRSTDANLQKNRELQWVREIYNGFDKRLIIKLPAKLIVKWLYKLQDPQKHDAPDKGLGSLLDTYERLYLSLGNTAPGK